MKIASVQTDVTFADPDRNLARMRSIIVAHGDSGTRLFVFPECFLTGYCFTSAEEAATVAEPIPGPLTDSIIAICAEFGVAIVVGMLESVAVNSDQSPPRLHNVAVLCDASGVVGVYRKTHLPWLGVDQFTKFGTEMTQLYEIDGVRIGMLICYDGGFPEPSRALALAGADLIVLPTNWPPGAETMAEYAINTRAMENAVYYLSSNRIGLERGFRFIGQSRICDPAGNTVASTGEKNDTVIFAEIDPEISRQKRLTRVPEKHVIDRFADRHPELYGKLTEPHSLDRPGRS